MPRRMQVDLALDHLRYTHPDDLLLFDRGYLSYLLLATLVKLPKRHASHSLFKKIIFDGTSFV